MIDKILVEQKNNVKKIACMDGGDLVEFFVVDWNKANEGNIYLGKISKKIVTANNKKAYFVNIGDTKEAFINAEEKNLEDLEALEGQDIIVQVSQEQRAEKGARVVRFLRLAGVYLVYDPYGDKINISNKIEDEEIRNNLINIVSQNVTSGGFTIRTSALLASVDDILAEMKYLENLFKSIINKAKSSKSPCLLYAQDNIIEEIISRQNTSLNKIIVDNHVLEEDLLKFGDVEYDKNAFENNGVLEMIDEALQKEVNLKCGGRVIIEETKAFVSIDVDSGEGYAQGGFNRLNNEASVEIAKQIILRNLSGKIIIDYAGISEYKFLKNSIEILEKELSDDVCKAKVLGLSRGGNVEIIRNRRRPTLQDLFSEECHTCKGTGRVERWFVLFVKKNIKMININLFVQRDVRT